MIEYLQRRLNAIAYPSVVIFKEKYGEEMYLARDREEFLNTGCSGAFGGYQLTHHIDNAQLWTLDGAQQVVRHNARDSRRFRLTRVQEVRKEL